MYKKQLMRVVLCLIVILAARVLLIHSLDVANVTMTDYIDAKENVLLIDDDFEGLKVIDKLEPVEDRLDMMISSNGETYSLFIRQMMYAYEIYVDGQLFSQNIEDDGVTYMRSFSYEIIDVDNETHIRIIGEHLDQIEFFIGKKNTVENANELRVIVYMFKFMVLIFFLILFSVMYLHKRSEKYFFVLMIIAMTSIIKSIALSELPALALLTGIDINNLLIIDRATTMINTVLPIIITIYAFEIKFPRRIYRVLMILLSIVSIALLLDFNRFSGIILIILSLFSLGIILYGAAHKKRYYQLIVLNSIIYFSFGVYKINVMNGIYRTGLIHFYTNTAYIGAIIYLVIFAIFFFEKYRRKIEASVNVKKEFERIQMLRGISHDLRLPLSVIKISSQMMESGKLDDQQTKEFARDITEEVDILKRMTDNIDMYLKLGHKENKSCVTSVRTVFERIEKDFNRLNADRKYLFCVSYDEEEIQVDIEALELYRMMYNLVDNAFKYCKQNDKITISYKVKNRLEIMVEDTGIGMDNDKLDKIFSPFYRLDDNHSKEGLGLGLSVVKAIVDKCDGEIVIKSKEGVGTLVHIVI